MSKEILTRLQEKYNRGDLPYHTSSKLVYSYDLLWLFEQAERVQELEKIKDAKIALVNKGDEEKRYVEQERMIELEKRNKRYREAIEKALAECVKNKLYTAENILAKALEEPQ